ncbi:MAG: oxidoreductase [Myxococcales bacterium 68-20]|nr:SDR family oxidoreductase [Myxococcales bacterium]OJY26620.1 MAG: oxidoreductase [Myxococcales bacterium 68-20]
MPRAGYDSVVLLTGFPSFAARKMCEELVRGPDRTLVHAVVRSKSLEEAEGALDALPLEQRRRVVLVEGDAAAMDYGLSGAELRALTPEIDIIHHMAQVSYLGADRKLAQQVNVNGAREALEVASQCKSLRNLVYHSTAQVSGDRTGLVLEDELDKGQSFRNVVEETIARGERIVRSRMLHKLPISIVRPTLVVGDSQSGEVDRFDGLYFLILLIVTSPPDFPLPLPGRGDTLLNVVPIDYVVRAANAIGRDPRAPGRTFHIGDPAPLTARRVFELVATAGGRRSPRGFIPANLTKALLRTPGLDRLAKSPRAFLDALATPVSYSFANTTELLADGDIRCPPFESYVDALVEYVQHRLREKRERDREPVEVEDPFV